MENLFFRIIEKILIIYFIGYFISDLLLFLYSIILFSRKKKTDTESKSYADYPVSIIVPAYNEEVSIVSCIKMLLAVDYPVFEVILVNDGSVDDTKKEILKHFQLEKKEDISSQLLLNTTSIKSVYHNRDERLVFIDKLNGGKADSINAGINIARFDYVCTIDADSILDPLALKEVVTPFIKSDRTMVSGGQLAASNDTFIKNGKIENSRIPSNLWVLWQVSEYIKSFMVSRLSLSKINALLIMSGAFSMYKKEEVMAVGGFLTVNNNHPYILSTLGKGKQTVCEDMEIVVRLYRYRRDQKQKARAVFMPSPVCWTEVPDNGRNLFRQRSRWHQGLAETLKIHRKVIFEPAYGVTGMLGMPYYFLFELFAPLIKIFALGFILISIYLDLMNYEWVFLFLLVVLLITTIIMTSITAIIENWSRTQSGASRDALRYKSFGDWLKLIAANIIAEFSYAFFKIFAQLSGLLSFLLRHNDWKKFERKGISEK